MGTLDLEEQMGSAWFTKRVTAVRGISEGLFPVGAFAVSSAVLDCENRRLHDDFGHHDRWYVEFRTPTWNITRDWPPREEIPKRLSCIC